MNPAYVTRRMMGDYSDYHRGRTHLTGLQHTRSETAPDDWESSALESLRTGAAEVMEFTETGGNRQRRAMRFLVTEAECLRCHAHQGHPVGEILGGVSISVPLAPYVEYRNRDMAVHGISFGVLWLVGCAGIIGAARRLSLGLADRDRAEELLLLSQQNYRALVDSSLTGICISRGDTILFGNARFAAIHS